MENTKREVNLSDDLNEDDIEALENTEFDETGKPIEAPAKEAEETIEETDEKTDEVEEEPEVVEEEVKDEEPDTSTGIKDVVGETPREKALRFEVTRIKREKRELMQQNVLLSQPKKANESWKDNLRNRGYTDEQIEEQEKLQDDMALAKGYVSKADLEKDNLNNVFEDFLEEHKEYSPEYDKEDIRYNRFCQILKSDYNFEGASKTRIKSIFNKVHRDINEELGEVKDTIKSDKNKINAQKAKIESVSVSTSGGKGVSKTESKEAPKKIGNTHIVGGLKFQGFDEDDF